MCLAVPGEIISINKKNAKINFNGIFSIVDISFINNPKIKEYVLVHVGFAIQKISEKEAKETYHILEEIENG